MGRFNSLFGRLGKFRARWRKINGLARRIRPPIGPMGRFSQYLPVEQRNQRGAAMSRRQKPSGHAIRSTAA
jgi:hypothetical protein